MSQYQATLDFLYSQLPMYQRVGPIAFKKGLGNTRALLKALGNPERTFQSIHIAGTNGKGTVSHMMAACLQAAGYKVGLYTSPHYRDFRERIKIDGEMVARKEIIDFVGRIKEPMLRIKPSFFEITVAMAFDAFRSYNVDVAVVETGLGGRLDSTNVIKPVLSVITNIGFDHMQMLGNTIPKIAKEKAGIIKKGVPVVVGEWARESAPVFNRVAEQRNAPISYASRSLKTEIVASDWDMTSFNVSNRDGLVFEDLVLGASGPYQGKNLVTALKAMEVIRSRSDYYIGRDHVYRGMRDIRPLTAYKGRWQLLSRIPLVLADSAHNLDGLRLALRHILQHDGPLHFVLGFANDKDLGPILPLFPKHANYYFARPDVPRGLDAGALQRAAAGFGLNGKAYSSVRSALAAAKRKAGESDLVYVGGSSFVVAEVV